MTVELIRRACGIGDAVERACRIDGAVECDGGIDSAVKRESAENSGGGSWFKCECK